MSAQTRKLGQLSESKVRVQFAEDGQMVVNRADLYESAGYARQMDALDEIAKKMAPWAFPLSVTLAPKD